MMASSNGSSSDWFIHCGCTTHISGCRSIFITYTKYPPNTKKVKRSNGVASFVSGYGSVRLICQLPDGKMETIILQEVVHLAGSFNLISQCRLMDKDVKVEPLNHYHLNLYNRHAKLISTAPQVDGIFIPDQTTESTEYTDIEDSSLLALTMTGHASRHGAEKRMICHCCLAHIGLNSVEIWPTITNASRITSKCDCESCIKCKLTRKPITLNMSSGATEPLQLMHSNIYDRLETAIGGGRKMLLFIDNATRHTEE